MTSRISVVLLSLILLAAPTAFGARTRDSQTTAPDFTLPTPAGAPVSLHDLRGKVVLVDFWASWCMPCRQSFPWMSSILDKYSKQGLAVVAVNLDKDNDAAENFLARFPASFVVGFDPSGKTAEAFRVQAMPSSFIVNRQGQIVYAHQGFEQAEAGSIEEHIKQELSK